MPQLVGDEVVGRVWSFRDVTERDQLLRRATFLADAARLLSSLDVNQALEAVAHLAVPYLGEYCAVDLLHNGQPERLVVTGAGADRRRAPDVHPRALASHSVIYSAGSRSHMAVPLMCRDSVVGAVTFVAPLGRAYSKADLELADELARRMALSIDNARLYQAAQAGPQRPRRVPGDRRPRDPRPADVDSPGGPRPAARHAASGRRPHRARRDPARRSTPQAVRRRAARPRSHSNGTAALRAGGSRSRNRRARRRLPARGRLRNVRLRRDGHDARHPRGSVGPVPTRTGRDQPALERRSSTGRASPSRSAPKAPTSASSCGSSITASASSPAWLAKIFDPFERAVGARHYGGLGLGLHIAKTIVEGFGGTIGVDSRPGAGATFTVDLPVSRSSDR